MRGNSQKISVMNNQIADELQTIVEKSNNAKIIKTAHQYLIKREITLKVVEFVVANIRRLKFSGDI